MALFGPSDLLLGTHVQSLCDALDIPHLEARYKLGNDTRVPGNRVIGHTYLENTLGIIKMIFACLMSIILGGQPKKK